MCFEEPQINIIRVIGDELGTKPFFAAGGGEGGRPRLDHIFIQLGPAPPTPPSLPVPAWKLFLIGNPVKIIKIKVDITFIIPKLIDGVPSHAKGA